MTQFKPRWYCCMESDNDGVAQVEGQFREAVFITLPETVLRLAQAEYERQQGNRQDYERMQERGGLGVLEVVHLLADYVERLGGEPTTPRGEA